MKISRKKYNIVSIVLLICFFICLLIGNIFHATIKAAVVSGSYADIYAKQKKIDEVELTDIEKERFDIRYETFEYDNNDDGTITIKKYNGISDRLVIPEAVNGKKVYGLSNSFFETLSKTSDIYLPSSISAIEFNEENDRVLEIKFHCYEKCNYYMNNSETNLNIVLMNDSEYINFSLGDCEFRYNDLGQEIEIVGYTGKDSNIVIPSHINGKPVTKLEFNMLGKYSLIVFPETITEINGVTSKYFSSDIWGCAVLFFIIAFITNIISMNLIFTRLRKKEEIILTSPIVIITYLYLIIQGIYSCLVIYKNIGTFRQTFIVGVLLLACYVVFITLATVGRHHTIEVDNHIEEETKEVKYLKSIAIGLSDKINDEQLKNKMYHIEEDIKYMPLMKNNINEIIVIVEKLKNDIESGDLEAVKKECNDLNILLKNN